MGKFSKVLIATDLDGTLLNSQKKVGAASLEAIRYFMSEGGHFTFSTGRLYQSFTGIADIVPYNAPVIFANGAQIVDLATTDLIYERPLEDDAIEICREVLAKFPGAAAELYAHKRSAVVQYNDISIKHMLDFKIEHTLFRTLEEFPRPWAKVLFTEETETLREIAAFIRERYSKATVCFSSKHFLEVFHSAVDKGTSTHKLAEILGISKDDIYTSGDQENDLALLKAAKIAFAPANALPSVKEQVDMILPDNDHDMMAALIAHLDSLY